MSNIKIIKPYNKRPASMNTLAGSLYKEGLSRAPMTALSVYPLTDARGVIQTGIDENALKIKAIRDPKARELEFARVKALREDLEFKTNELLDPASAFWTDEINGKMSEPYSLKDGDNVFDMNDPYNAIDFYWLTQLPIVAKSLDDINSGKADPAIVSFYVYESEVVSRNEFNRKKEINDVVSMLNKLGEVEIKKVAFILNLKMPEKSTYSELYVALDNYIKEPKVYGKEDPIEEFKRVATYTAESLNIKVLIKQLLEERILKVKGTSVFEGENLIAKSIEDFEIKLAEDPNEFLSYEAKTRAKKDYIDNL